MAIYHLNIESVSRSDRRSAVAAAAYRAGERLRDERTGRWHDHRARTDVLHQSLLQPSGVAAVPEWAQARGALWNEVERHESRRNARLAREYRIALPAELDGEQRIALARRFSQSLADRHHVIVDLAVHAPRSAGDARNFHAHLLLTTREITAEGFGAKAGLDMSSAQRAARALLPGIREMRAIREQWADLANEALREAGLEQRVDHRTLRAQGLARDPKPHIPYAAIQMERRGEVSVVAERLRAEYRERLRSREAYDPQAIRRQAVEAWRALRAERHGREVERAPAVERVAERGADLAR